MIVPIPVEGKEQILRTDKICANCYHSRKTLDGKHLFCTEIKNTAGNKDFYVEPRHTCLQFKNE